MFKTMLFRVKKKKTMSVTWNSSTTSETLTKSFDDGVIVGPLCLFHIRAQDFTFVDFPLSF